MFTPFAAGKGLVLLAFGMLGWYISMTVGSPTMRHGLFREVATVQVVSIKEDFSTEDPSSRDSRASLGIFHSSQTDLEAESASQQHSLVTDSRTGMRYGRGLSKHASKVPKNAQQTAIMTSSAVKQSAGSQQKRSQASISTCPPLNEPRQSEPSRTYPQPRNRDRGNCSCTPIAPFILLSMQRSGSGWVETLLNSHPNLRSHGEVFKVRKREEGWNETRDVLEEVFDMERVKEEPECLSAVGLKWMLNQGALQFRRELVDFLQERGVSVVVLLRRNSLRRLISVLANIYDQGKRLVDGKEHMSHVHSQEEADKLAHFKPRLNPETLLPHLRHVQQTADAALKALKGTRHLVVYYEDVLSDPKTIQRLQEFLGVPTRLLQSKQVQIHRHSLEQHIANWEEVKSTLAGTEFEHMLQ